MVGMLLATIIFGSLITRRAIGVFQTGLRMPQLPFVFRVYNSVYMVIWERCAFGRMLDRLSLDCDPKVIAQCSWERRMNVNKINDIAKNHQCCAFCQTLSRPSYKFANSKQT